MRWRWKRSASQNVPPTPSLAYPYYVDEAGLRALADSLGIELPRTKTVSTERHVSLAPQGAGASGSWSTTAEVEGHLHLNHLAVQLKRSPAYRDVVDVLGLIPPLDDRGILRAAIAQLQNMPDDLAEHHIEEKLQAAYAAEREQELGRAKRAELKQVATQNQLVIVRGTFEAVPAEDGGRISRVRLTHLEPAEVVYETSDTPESQPQGATSELPMPDGVGIEAVLPSDDAFTSTGLERLGRGAPFYGHLIGHSASFEDGKGILTCSAYAIWGMPRPNPLLEEPVTYEFLER